MLRIDYLVNHPSLVTLLADWFYEEWGGRRPEDSLEGFKIRLQGRMNQDRLPLALIAFFEGEPVGTAALKIREMETHPHFEHWLGSVYVQESHRKRGFGTKLIQAIISEAARFGIEELYLYTRGSEIFYSKLGWKEIEKPFFRGRRVTIMKYLLPKVS